MRKGIKIYPFNHTSLPFIYANDILSDYRIDEVIIPKEWKNYLESTKVLEIVKKSHISVSENFHEAIEQCENLLIAEFETNSKLEDCVCNKLISAVNSNIKTINTQQFSEENKKRILNNINSKELFSDVSIYKNDLDKIEINRYKNRQTPIILIAGTSEDTLKFNIQIILRRELIKKGYKVSQIGTKSYCELFGFHSYPSYMSEIKFSSVEKIFGFNNLLHYIEIIEKPDVIIVGLPGGTFPISDEDYGDFGINSYICSKAFIPDYTIFTTWFDNYNIEFSLELIDLIEKRFNYIINKIGVSNRKIDVYGNNSSRRNYLYINEDIINSKLHELGNPFFNSSDEKSIMELADDIILNLSENIQVQKMR